MRDVAKMVAALLIVASVLGLLNLVIDYRNEKAEYLEIVKKVCVIHTTLGFNKESGCNVILGQRFFRMWYAENMQ